MDLSLKFILKALFTVAAFPLVFVAASLDKDDIIHHAWVDTRKGNPWARILLIECFLSIALWLWVIYALVMFFA